MVMRLHDWEARLVSYIVAHMGAPFAYGRSDCALFAAGAVEAMTGEDLAADFRGYRTLKAGHEALVARGFADHIELAASLLSEVSPALAHRGDVMVVQGAGGLALGILQGEVVYCLTRRDGIALVPRSQALRAFSVPFPS